MGDAFDPGGPALVEATTSQRRHDAIVNDKNRIVGTRKLFCPSTASEMSVRRIVFRQIVLPLFTV